MDTPHHILHERIRKRALEMGLPAEVLRRLREDAKVLAVMPDEVCVKRKHFTMGKITFKIIVECIRRLKKIGVRQDTAWAMMADILLEFTNAKLREAGLELIEFDLPALHEEWLESETSIQYERKRGSYKKSEIGPVRHRIDWSGRPLAMMPCKSEIEAAKAAEATTNATTQGEQP